MSNKIVEIRGEEAFTTSKVVADECHVEHKAVLQLLDKYSSEFNEFGPIPFEMGLEKEGGGGRPTRVALLTYNHASYLVTLLRNNDTVRLFKRTLIKEFDRAIKEIELLREGIRHGAFIGQFLLPESNGKQRLLSERFIQLYCEMYNIPWDKTKGCPVALCGFLGKTLYSLFPGEVRSEMKSRRLNSGEKYYRWLNDALVEHVEQKVLSKVEGMLVSAAQHHNKKLFWDSWTSEFEAGDQLSLAFSPKNRVLN